MDNSRSKKFNLIIKISLLLLAVAIFYFVPYTHDDWAWGSSIGIDRLTSLFKDYNGRWAGNLVVLALTRFRFLKAIISAGTIYFIVMLIRKIVDEKNNQLSYIAIILMLLMPIGIIAQAIAWTSGFSNYTISFVFTLLFIYLNKDMFNDKEPNMKIILIIPMLFMGFIAALFLENLTIYNIVLALFIVGYHFFKNKKIIFSNLAFLIGSCFGAILMFSNGAYHNVVSATDDYRSIAHNNIFVQAFNTYFESMYEFLVQNNLVVNIVLGSLLVFIILNYMEKNKKKISKPKTCILNLALFVFIGYIGYLLFLNLNDNVNLFVKTDYRRYIDGILAIVFYLMIIISIFIVIDNKEKKKRILFELFSIIVLTAPLFIVTPIGPRNFFQNYVLYTIIICELISYIKEKKSSKIDVIFILLSFVLLMCYFLVFLNVYRIDSLRINIINNSSKNAKTICLPNLPNVRFMHGPNPVDGIFEERFKLFYGIDKDVEIVFE